MRQLDARLRAAAAQESAPAPLPLAPARPHGDAWRGLLVSGVGLAAAAALALGIFVWRATDSANSATTPSALADSDANSPPKPVQTAPEVAVSLGPLLDQVQANTPSAIEAGVQLQDWAGFLLIDLPAANLDPIRALAPSKAAPPARSEELDRVS